ncbi:Hypothetical protein CAP_9028 [Chondromyces apiculatus DSM 436]|uniref:Uncharacterized protein n=1 Tax=Chondromyces apiculatus DSM 436 TaxID=1192034 RepID=A0A017SVV7_9BACT|nr:Hypothetical protein CAP_9028 [Chondromyces apiculatus DSM 436]
MPQPPPRRPSPRRPSGAGVPAPATAAPLSRCLPFPVSVSLSLSVCLSLPLLLAPAPAAAAPPPTTPPPARLTVLRAPEASDCPDARALAAAVEVAMKRPALDPQSVDPSAPAYDIQIFRPEADYAAILQAGGLTRQISDPGPTCAGLAEALVITLAILLDSEAPSRPAPEPEPPATPLPDGNLSPRPVTPPVGSVQIRPAPAPAPPGLLATAPGSILPRPPAPAPPDKPWDLSLDLGAAQTLGLLTPFSWAFYAEASLRLPRVSFAAGALWLPSRTLDVPPGEVDVSLALATARACAAVAGRLDGPRLSACAQPMLGAFTGVGRGYNPDRQATVLWMGLGALLLGEGPIVGPLGWSARASVVAPLVTEELTIDRVEGPVGAQTLTVVSAFDPSPIGFLVGAGLRVSIP